MAGEKDDYRRLDQELEGAGPETVSQDRFSAAKLRFKKA
jgi:hypothetical protein